MKKFNKNRIVKMSRTFCLILFMISILYSCVCSCNTIKSTVNKEISFSTDSLSCLATLKIIKIKEISGVKHSFVYAQFTINNNSKKEIQLSLKDFKLKISDKIVGILYIDSIASILIEQQKIPPHSKIEKSIYWGFQGIVEKKDLNSAKILYSNTRK